MDRIQDGFEALDATRARAVYRHRRNSPSISVTPAQQTLVTTTMVTSTIAASLPGVSVCIIGRTDAARITPGASSRFQSNLFTANLVLAVA